ncbi:Crp/Fnr family transcriptional regulator [Lichenifustis flavocetrariae]|uniref:Crp/Fnr family transcriptional regulator n=1 Tax=Lichenifustis flavocetrariae TaxID=2949735 RepID=A0AA41Z503_9HYPH|nr:Crp/Fnr family transcriptional regulator [Lichenifustis flavocetrariae]MCW6513063.1 Crp/Fnr family transcriptional regulator [Lichenifustis flavocetrariae]
MSVNINGNRFLASLSVTDYPLLHRHLRPFDMMPGAVLVEAGGDIDRVYFPHSGIISIVVRLTDGQTVEAAMIGHDGVFGCTSALSGLTATSTAMIQMAGRASTLESRFLRAEALRSPLLLDMIIRHEQMVYGQALQSVACNAVHTIRSRLPRWLLHARDLAGSGKLTFSQDLLAQMLGTHRNSVSIVANELLQSGLIHYSRGHIQILDPVGLREKCCECYKLQKNRPEMLINKIKLDCLEMQ